MLIKIENYFKSFLCLCHRYILQDTTITASKKILYGFPVFEINPIEFSKWLWPLNQEKFMRYIIRMLVPCKIVCLRIYVLYTTWHISIKTIHAKNIIKPGKINILALENKICKYGWILKYHFRNLSG